MRRIATVALACVVAAGCAGPTVGTAPSPNTTFSVDGRRVSCGPAATVQVGLGLAYPGPDRHAFFLDGVEIADTAADPGNPYGSYFRTTAQRLEFSCEQPGTHRVRMVTGHSAEHYVGCSVRMSGSPIPGEGVVGSGKSIEHPVTNTWDGQENRCDVTWTTP